MHTCVYDLTLLQRVDCNHITDYRIKKKISGGYWDGGVPIGSNQPIFRLTDLQPDTEYAFRVSAFNKTLGTYRSTAVGH